MRLTVNIPRPTTPATDVLRFALDDFGGFTGDPGVFFQQLAKKLRIDTRTLVGAAYTLHNRGKLTFLKGGTSCNFVVGVCRPGYTFGTEETIHLGTTSRY